MLISEYALGVINTRPYKYLTRQAYFKDLKHLGYQKGIQSTQNSNIIEFKKIALS